ncbi:protein O-D-mannosyltransferase [Zychaea mexicana]|uniref:protein O-D-mannosyltransferase n=1 Tax=Zychaea mexicana TaxID=64656 RepID=UPI0022FE4236|nr:protein O-D-mannosyltransferase [Zychaea mexicana]KAI9495812.1 protein O-D-mannosyltransferase [Zychaea mexicana]
MENELRQRKRARPFQERTPLTWKDGLAALALGAMAIPIRMNALDEPHEVVFDEVHFGTFANKYINKEFFFDVHPPLAKMLIALAGRAAGYDGNFDFSKIGNDYTTGDVPYVAMRTVGAQLGLLMVPMIYMTLRQSGISIHASLFAALALCYENSMVANNRLILLDAPLLFFTALTILCWTRFFNQSSQPFGRRWWFWLAFTGVNLGLTVSCKWVGLFTIATIGVSTVRDLWRILGDLNVTKKTYNHHILARVICLVVIPVSIYISTFYFHFLSLPLSGDGDAHMSAAFQHSLVGHEVPDSPIDIAYGSKITVRHLATNGGYLHSHKSSYPQGSKQQQVTLYPHRDENNWWVIRKLNSTLDEANDPADVMGADGKTWIQYIRHGDIVRLEHVSTSPRKLHSHDETPPMTDVEYHKEVSAYGFPNFEGDANDFWRVDIEGAKEGDKLQTLRSNFRLFHALQSCSLFSHPVQLPDWGFGQQEVTCIQNGKKPKTMWVIEESTNDLLPEGTEMVNYKVPGFWSKFIELHKVMWTANEGLTQSHPYESRPSSWPTLRSGISFWATPDRHIYFIGNPVVYWASTVAIFQFFILWFFFQLRGKRGYSDHYQGRRAFYESTGGFYVMGWLMHYLPFYLMNRQLFLHHYLPSLYFAILVLAVGVDLALTKFSPKGRVLFVIILSVATISVFREFEPLTYGKEWTNERCQANQWLDTWQFGCEKYPTVGSIKPLKKVVLNDAGTIVGDDAMAESLLHNNEEATGFANKEWTINVEHGDAS